MDEPPNPDRPLAFSPIIGYNGCDLDAGSPAQAGNYNSKGSWPVCRRQFVEAHAMRGAPRFAHKMRVCVVQEVDGTLRALCQKRGLYSL
jgi:hypothetical protein